MPWGSAASSTSRRARPCSWSWPAFRLEGRRRMRRVACRGRRGFGSENPVMGRVVSLAVVDDGPNSVGSNTDSSEGRGGCEVGGSAGCEYIYICPCCWSICQFIVWLLGLSLTSLRLFIGICLYILYNYRFGVLLLFVMCFLYSFRIKLFPEQSFYFERKTRVKRKQIYQFSKSVRIVANRAACSKRRNSCRGMRPPGCRKQKEVDVLLSRLVANACAPRMRGGWTCPGLAIVWKVGHDVYTHCFGFSPFFRQRFYPFEISRL